MKSLEGQPASCPTVFVVDDNPAVRDSLQLLLETVGISTCGFATAEAFLTAFRAEGPGCLLLDVRMPGMGGLELMRVLEGRRCLLPVIYITGHADVPMAVRAMKGGALDILEKPFNQQILLEKIHAALKVNENARRLNDQRAAVEARLARLTHRERQALDLMLPGKAANKVIARQLGITSKTLTFYRSRILEKMGAESLLEVAHMIHSVQARLD